jgi:23S rRNA (adenine1618-N6)-methyltransferase
MQKKSSTKREHPVEKTILHPRNKHRERYDFHRLIAACEELKEHVTLNNYGDESIDFANPIAVKLLNKAILKSFYSIEYWDIPENYLCPPIPGRADYIHYMADELALANANVIPKGAGIKVLDIGVGANLVYPILGHQEYDWSFVGTDIDTVAMDNAQQIIDQNKVLKGAVELRLQANPKNSLPGMIKKGEQFDFTMCNPPFHPSYEEAMKASQRKVSNLKGQKVIKPILNFGGQQNELWCEGGELQFIKNYISQSKQFKDSCFWFTTLLSQQSNLENLYRALRSANVTEAKTVLMGQGNKISRIVLWTFLTADQQAAWKAKHWS